MATSGIKTKFTLEGEKEYKQALANINTSLKTLDSEMALVKQTYKGSEESIEALTKTNDLLNRQILTQQDKLSALENMLKKSADAYGESDAKTQKYQQQVNKAKEELIKMEQALAENTNQLHDAGQEVDNFSGGLEDLEATLGHAVTGTEKSADSIGKLGKSAKDGKEKTAGLGDAVGTLADKLGIRLPSAATNAMNSLGSVNSSTMLAVGGVGALAAALVKVEQALINVTRESAQFADEIATKSLTSGLSTQTLQEMEYAAKLIDVSTETITGSMTKLTNKIQDASSGNEAAMESFKKLGVSVTDAGGDLRKAEDVFYDVIDALGEVQNQTERDALAMDLMGKSAQDLNPLIIQGTGKLKALAAEAERTGYVMDESMISALVASDDAFQRLEKSRDAFKNGLAVQFAPYLAQFYTDMTNRLDKFSKKFKDTQIIESLGTILVSIGDITGAVGELFGPLMDLIDGPLSLIAGLTAKISDIIDIIPAIFDLDFKRIGSDIGFYFNKNDPSQWSNYQTWYMEKKYRQAGAWYDSATGQWTQSAYSSSNPYHATGTRNFSGGLTWVGENGPELVSLPRGSQILSAQESRTVGDTFYITVNASNIKELNDLVRIAKNAQRMRRMEGSLA